MQYRTKFTRKQAGAIYHNVKEGRLEMSKEAVGSMYDLVGDGWDVDFTGDDNRAILDLRLAIDAIFADDFDRAQKHLDSFAA